MISSIPGTSGTISNRSPSSRRLDEGEEKKLGERARRGDRDALQSLIEGQPPVRRLLRQEIPGHGPEHPGPHQRGNVGLIEAAKRFDPSRNVRFVSYAVWWIRQAIVHALSRYSRIYHIPQKLSDQISHMKRKAAELKTGLGREPTREEIARAMGLGESEIEDLEILAERNLSLSDRFHEDDFEFEDRISDPDTPPVEYQIIKTAIQQQIRDILGELDEKEALVLKLRFGLDDDRARTLQEIGDQLGLSRERVRQIEQKAMRKLGRSQKLQQLRGYLN
jgi:RNA polymerase primary sigma factor